eukprot:COSAG05_NODE_2640_length_2812_cov_471.011680_4_plen_97_part_00
MLNQTKTDRLIKASLLVEDGEAGKGKREKGKGKRETGGEEKLMRWQCVGNGSAGSLVIHSTHQICDDSWRCVTNGTEMDETSKRLIESSSSSSVRE